MEALSLYLLLGAVAGTIAGLLGVGGGLIIVPVLVFIFVEQGIASEIIMHLAIGTSLATIVVTSLSSIRAHHQHQAVLWPVFKRLTPGIIIGTLFGAAIADLIPTVPLRIFFAGFVVVAAMLMLFDFKPAAHRELPGTPGMTLAGGVIGVLSALVGIGGGTVTTPFLLWCNTALRNAIATSAACGLPIAVSGALGYIIAGLDEQHLPPWSSGYVYWPAFFAIIGASAVFAPLGAKLTHTLPVKVLKKIFAALLLVIAARMLML